MTNINSLRHNASCTPSVHNNRTCHIVYLDGAPSYPASGYNLSLTLIMCEVLTFIFCRPCFWYSLAGTIQWISTHTTNLSFGPFSCGIRRKHHVSRSRGWNVSVFEFFFYKSCAIVDLYNLVPATDKDLSIRQFKYFYRKTELNTLKNTMPRT